MATKTVDPKRSAASKKAAETRRKNKIAAENRVEQEKTNSSRNWNWLPWALLGLFIFGMLLWHPWTVPTAPTTAATALWTPATCSSLSTEMGIPLTVLTEGDGFIACKYTGPIVKINIPDFTIVDADKGSVEVWVNSSEIVSLEAGNTTFRLWNGKLDSACAHLIDLTTFGHNQNPPFTPVAGNFTCPEQ